MTSEECRHLPPRRRLTLEELRERVFFNREGSFEAVAGALHAIAEVGCKDHRRLHDVMGALVECGDEDNGVVEHDAGIRKLARGLLVQKVIPECLRAINHYEVEPWIFFHLVDFFNKHIEHSDGVRERDNKNIEKFLLCCLELKDRREFDVPPNYRRQIIGAMINLRAYGLLNIHYEALPQLYMSTCEMLNVPMTIERFRESDGLGIRLTDEEIVCTVSLSAACRCQDEKRAEILLTLVARAIEFYGRPRDRKAP